MKTCQANDTCVNPVFGTDKNTRIGYCRKHQYLRTDLKKPLRKSFVIAKRSPKKPIPSLSFGFFSQPDLFTYCWENAKNDKGRVICKYTKIDITYMQDKAYEYWVCCFAHVLPKSKYPYFKLNPANIRVVFPLFHTIADQGTSDEKKELPSWKFEQWDREVEEMKDLYKVFKKENLLP